LFLLFFAQDIAHIDGGYSSTDFNVLAYFLLAAFAVTTIGRFWVTAEAPNSQQEGQNNGTGNEPVQSTAAAFSKP
jgi:hypothetical protein